MIVCRTGGVAAWRSGVLVSNDTEPMIPSYNGKTIEIIRLDGPVQLWTSDN